MASILFIIARIWDSEFKCNYVKNEKLVLNFLFDFWKLQQIWNILKEKLVIANIFPNLNKVKILVRPLSEKRHFRKRFDSQLVKLSQILAKAPWGHLYHFFSPFWWKLLWKMFPLVLGEF